MKKVYPIIAIIMALAGQLNAQSPLCSSYPTTFCCEYVSSVTINGITRAGAPDATGFTSGPGYFDYTGELLTSFVAGNTYPVSVTVKTNSNYQEFVKIWFDFNGNGNLNDAGELVFDQVNTFNGTLVYSGNITVPTTAFNGNVYIRVVMVYANSPALCGTYSYGTTLDFKASISGGLTPRNLGVTTTSSGGYSGSVVSNPSGINTASGLYSVNFPNGADVTLTATAGSGGSFISWSGDATGNSNPLLITLNSDMDIVANFGPPNSKPTLTTISASAVTTSSAASGGNISSDGNMPVTARGTCWNTSANPTTANSLTSDGTGTGTFSSSLTGLTPGTIYYVKAYATNSVGTAYGNQVTFTTPPSDPTSVSASATTIFIGSSTELTAGGPQGTVYWYTGSCGGTVVGTGNPLTVSPTITTTYYARNSSNSVFSNGCASVTITVNKYDQTITFDPIPEKIYGLADFSPASASSGLTVNYTSSNTSVSTIVDNKVHIVGAGSSDITASQPGNSSFNAASDITRTLTVSKASLTATADNKDKNYGGANPVLTITYSGFVYSESETVLDTKPLASIAATVFSNAGTYPIELSTGTDNNYEITINNGTLTINEATLTVTADNQTRVYGEANHPLTFQYSGWLNGDDFEDLTTEPTAAATINELSPVGVYSNDITIAGGADENYLFSYIPANLTITKATLTATADAKTKIYGEANPHLTFQYSGWLNGDNSEDLTTEPFAAATVNELSDVGVYSNDITIAGGADENYLFSYIPANLTITKATLTATADAKTKIYGEANPPLTFQYSGWLNGDDSEDLTTEPTAAATVNELSPVGVYSNDITIAGGADENYSFSYVPANLTITKATLTATADAKTKIYGEANPPLTFQYSGWLNGDDPEDLTTEPLAAATVNELSDVGVYSNDITIASGTDENYSFSYVPANLTITKATLTATADAKTKIYGETNPPLTFQYSGWLNGDDFEDLTTEPIAAATVNELSPVGVYLNDITIAGGADENYLFSYVPTNLTITKATLTATADAKTKIYGETNPPLTFQYSGWLNGDDSEDLTTEPFAAATVNELSDVGVYSNDITIAGGSDENYSFSYVPANLTITKATLTVTADAKTKIYGETNPPLTFQYSGWLNGDNSEDLTTEPSAASTVTELSPVAVYSVDITLAGGTDENYSFSYVPADLTVTKANLTVSADDRTKVYGTVNPELTFTYSGFVNSDDESSIDTDPAIITTADVLSDAGSYPIVLANGNDNNYNLNRVDGALNITKAQITATADSKIKAYTALNPELTISYAGFKNSDNPMSLDLAPVASTTATQVSDAGSYPITLQAGSDNNYEISTIAGILTINKVSLTVTPENKTRLYGEENPALTVTYSGFVNGNTEDDLDVKAVATTTALLLDNTGVYTITSTGGVDNNYNLLYTDGSLTINKSTLAITAVDKTRKYGENNPVLSYSYSGFRNNDNEEVLDILPVIATTATKLTSVGLVPVTLTGGNDNNYDFTLNDGVMTISKTTLVISSDNKAKVYGSPNPVLTVSWSGFVNEEDQSVLTQSPLLQVNTDNSSNASVYPISVSGAEAENYSIEYLSGNLTVNKASLNVTAVSASKKYLGQVPALSVTIEGFENNDSESALDVIPTATTTADNNSDAGTYEIIASGGSDTNYSFIYKKGTLSILKADQDIIFEKIPEGLRTTMEYQLVATTTGKLPVEFYSSESSIVSVIGTNLTVEREGSVQITARQIGDNNWNPAQDVVQSFVTLPTFDGIRSLFTPNNDGMNDTWYIPDIEQYGNISIQIYNRFGKLLYESSAYKNDWKGTYNGTPLPSASYYYLIKSDVKGIVKGVVNIVR